jgi:predicted nucleotidyltransferase
MNPVENAQRAALTIKNERYPASAFVFAAGSIFRGEDTPYSDLDLVVIYQRLPNAYRESFRFQAFPVEAFVHDPETLKYFFYEVDCPSGVPGLPQMVWEGIEIPESSALSQALKAMPDR